MISIVLHWLRSSRPAVSRPESGDVDVDVGFDDASQRVLVKLSRSLAEGETAYARVRRGEVGELDCATAIGSMARIDGEHVDGGTYRGPSVDPQVFEPIYDDAWLEHAEPTPEMLEQAAEGRHVIDVCVLDGDQIVAAREFDARRALDLAGANGKFDGDEEERIASTEAYAEACVAELGDIPFFERLGDGDYGTYDCLESTPIPTTVTQEDGSVEYPDEEVAACDEPQYIYSLCEPNAEDGVTNGPRVNQRTNEEGTHWVLLCRKAKEEEGSYNDIAMIGHNPYTGKTCFFQNALYKRTDGLHVPHPGDRVESEGSPQQSASLWSGIHGGLGSGIQCARCHDSDPFIHTPWIDGAKDNKGDPIIPKMGIDEDFGLGYNDSPYSIVNTAGQGWSMPKHLLSEEAAACTKCHRIGDGRWAKEWFDRLEGLDETWTKKVTPAARTFERTFWMPPEHDGLDAESWNESEFAAAMAFIRDCAADPDKPECEWAELPRDETGDGSLPEIELTGAELAHEALVILGADVQDDRCGDGECASRRCAECHAVSRPGLRSWHALTQEAWDTCGLSKASGDMTADEAKAAVDCLRIEPSDESSPFEAAKLGIMTTGVQYGPFRELFRKAYGDDWALEYGRLKARVGMPKGNHPKLSQREYAVLEKWFSEDLVALEGELDEQPPPATCNDSLDGAALAAHIDEMKFEGWGALNADAGVTAYGCKAGDTAVECFADFGDRSASWGRGDSTIRELTELSFRTSFWTRSSADGRFVGNGGGNGSGSTITDLLQGRDIGVKASYDPGFFPDNSGFIFQGATGGAGICNQNVLLTGEDIDFEESACIKASGINLYQHVARGLGGGDYFVINSQFTSDSGTGDKDPVASFNESATMKLTPMLFDGTKYEPLDPVIVESPFEGDSVLSPSGKLVGSRIAGPEGKSHGYSIRPVIANTTTQGYEVKLGEPIATVCEPGAKVNFSFDERFFVTHRYENGRANLVLVDLADGSRTQITDMPEGYKALFPHFITNGWIYFLVHGPDDARWVAASDAAIREAAK